MTSLAAPLALRQRYQEGRLVPFVGAGLSMSVSWTNRDGEEVHGPSWAGLVDQAAKLLGFEDADLLRVRGGDLQILEYYREKNGGELAPLRNWFARTFEAPIDALASSPIHAALADLDRCPVYYTTNYDDFLERTLTHHGRRATAIAVEQNFAQALIDNVSAPHGWTQVVKFHGDLNNPSRMVLSERDYEDRLKFTALEDRRLYSDLIGRSVLFLGYSFRDLNVSYLFRLINDQLGERLPLAPSGRRAYIVVPDPSDFEYTLFRARNIEVIPVRGDRLTLDIAEILASLL